MEQREAAKNEHTQNIRAGIAVLKTMYSMHIDEYDYIDIAIDALRDIKNFGTTEYVTYVNVGKTGKVNLPCNVDVIDAVTTQHMGEKVFSTRVKVLTDEIVNTDTFVLSETIMKNIGRGFAPGLGGYLGPGYISYQLDHHCIIVDKAFADQRVAVAFTGIATDLDGYPLITRKQANALAAISARVLAVRGANRGDKGLASMVEYYTNLAGRLFQAAAIPEDITDNDTDEILNCKTTFNRKSVNRPTKYSR